MLLEIRRLLYTERYTIEGAKRRLRELSTASPDTGDTAPTAAAVRDELVALYRMLED